MNTPAPDCSNCRHSVAVLPETALRLVKHQGYANRGSGGPALVCEITRSAWPAVCRHYEREDGSDDE